MDLRVAGIGKERPTLVRAPDGGGVGALGVGGEVVDVAVTTCAEDDRVGDMHAELAGNEIAGDDTARLAVDHDEVEHLRAGDHGDGAGVDLALERLVRTEKKLLAGLAAGVKGARDLRAAEGTIGERAAVLTGEGNALGYALIDDFGADLREAIDVGFAGTEVAALDGIVEEAEDALAVVGVVLCRVDAALGCDGVRAARRILEAEALHLVAEFAKRGCRRTAGQTGTDDDKRMLALVGGVDELHIEAGFGPRFFNRAGRNSCVKCHYFTKPRYTDPTTLPESNR